jgi:TadE-like protein
MRRVRSRRIDPAARRRQRGVVLLEAAACVQVLAILAFGIVDVGFAYRDKLTLNSAVRGTARVVANAGPVVDADYQGLITLRGALGTIPQAQVDRVVIYKADVNGNPTNPNCLLPAAEALHGYVNDCNVYSANEIFNAPASSFTDCTAGLQSKFCPTTRVRPMSGSLPPTEVGVWLSIRYKSRTKLFPFAQVTITDQAVMRLEPEVV